MTADDMELVRQYAAHRSEPAFAALVSRHTSLVYSAALRQVGHPPLAEEITQAVFILLARKSGSLDEKTILSGWLYRTAGYVSASALKQERRRRQRESEAYMQSTLDEIPAGDAWPQLSPLLDEAMLRLGQADRDALVLRYFEGRSLGEVGTALGTGEDAAKKRVTRAVEKLRKFFARRGVTLSVAAIAGTISVNSVSAAPAGLAQTVAAVAIAKGAAAGGSISALVKGAFWGKIKIAAFIGIAVTLIAGPTIIILDKSKTSPMDAYISDIGLTAFQKAPPLVIVQPTHVLQIRGNPYIPIGRDDGGKLVGRSMDFKFMMSIAYKIDQPHMVFMTAPPTNQFDYLITTTNQPEEALQAEIQKVTGYVGRKVVRPTGVFLLKAGTNTLAKLKAGAGRYQRLAGPNSHGNDLYGRTYIGFPALRPLASYLEHRFDRPVIDQTGITNQYGVVVDWDMNRIPVPNGYTFAEAEFEHNETLKAAMHDQLGLELVSTNMPMEMLVVEKVK